LKKACIVIPICFSELSQDERLSIESFITYIAGYEFYAVVPHYLRNCVKNLPDEINYASFSSSHFESTNSYSRLLLTTEFYNAFVEYEFILIAQPDAIVLSDDLKAWCDKGWDYIGAPWAKNFKTHFGIEFEGVGNGGFSLRNVASALRVLNTKVSPVVDYTWNPKPRWWCWNRVKKAMLFINWCRRFLPKVTVERYLKKHYYGAEDIFWGMYAKKLDPSFIVAPVDDALHFAFEADPAGSFEKTGGKLPFGCHAWARYDRNFWVKMGVVPEKGK
jgi:hypothetical protein